MRWLTGNVFYWKSHHQIRFKNLLKHMFILAVLRNACAFQYHVSFSILLSVFSFLKKNSACTHKEVLDNYCSCFPAAVDSVLKRMTIIGVILSFRSLAQEALRDVRNN